MYKAQSRRCKKPGVNFSPLIRSIIIFLMNCLISNTGQISALAKFLGCSVFLPSLLPALGCLDYPLMICCNAQKKLVFEKCWVLPCRTSFTFSPKTLSCLCSSHLFL